MKYKCICLSCKYQNEKWNGEHCSGCAGSSNFDPVEKLKHELESGFYHTEREEMTREEAIAIIRKEYLCVDRDCDIERSCGKCDLMMPSKEPILEAYKVAIKALEHPERNVVAVVPCGDTISRQAVLEVIRKSHCEEWVKAEIGAPIEALPSVNPQPKTGHWIKMFLTDTSDIDCQCSECGFIYKFMYDKCPNCGCRMVEPQERSDKE